MSRSPEGEEEGWEVCQQEWCRKMRVLFSVPEVVHRDGSIRQEYFKPCTDVRIHLREWTHHDTEKLVQGIAHHGVGSWAEIIHDFLPFWDATALVEATAQLLGVTLEVVRSGELRGCQDPWNRGRIRPSQGQGSQK